MIAFFLNTSLGRAIAGAGALVMALLLIFHAGSRSGARKTKERANEIDRKEADRIRRDVRDARRRPVSGAHIKYRD